MLSGLLVAVVLLASLACPLMMWLGRRGIGPGCALMGCTPQREETIESLRAQQEELTRRIDTLDTVKQTDAARLERV